MLDADDYLRMGRLEAEGHRAPKVPPKPQNFPKYNNYKEFDRYYQTVTTYMAGLQRMRHSEADIASALFQNLATAPIATRFLSLVQDPEDLAGMLKAIEECNTLRK